MKLKGSMRMARAGAARFIAVVALVSLVSLSAVAGQRRGSGNGIEHYKLVSFPLIDRTLGYPTLRLSPRNFIEMAAVWVTLPKGFAHKLTAPTKCLQLEYGYKKGGVVRICEIPIVKGISEKAFLDEVVKARAFVDLDRRAGFMRATIPSRTMFLALSSVDKAAFLVAKADISGR